MGKALGAHSRAAFILYVQEVHSAIIHTCARGYRSTAGGARAPRTTHPRTQELESLSSCDRFRTYLHVRQADTRTPNNNINKEKKKKKKSNKPTKNPTRHCLALRGAGHLLLGVGGDCFPVAVCCVVSKQSERSVSRV